MINELLTFLVQKLGGPYPLYTVTPEKTPYPYLSLEVISIQYPQPRKALVQLKVQARSRATDQAEIHDMARHIQHQLCDRLLLMNGGVKASCRSTEEHTKLLNDRTTRVYETRLLMGVRQ